MTTDRTFGFRTRALHAGTVPDAIHGSRAVPIHQSTSFVFKDTGDAANLFALQKYGNIYSRIGNPTVAALEERLASLEGGIGAVATASGMSAEFLVFAALCQQGDHIVASSKLYGGTVTQLDVSLRRFGIETTFVNSDEAADFKAALQDNTKLIFTEVVTNPSSDVVDLPGIAEVAHEHGIPLVVDSTLTTPYLFRPIEHGADIVIHSATKYIGGHGTTIGGVIVDSGKFDWVANKNRFPMLNEPDPSYHDVVYTDALGAAAYIGRCRVVPLRNTGSALAPHSAFLIMQGLETLGLRMERHCENALAVANYLRQHPKVEWVSYAALPDSPYYANCQKITGGKASGILSFGIKGGKEAGTQFIDALQMILRLVNIGDAKSLACHPATTTHRQLNDEELRSAGVSADLVRLSVGIEHIDDIIADIEQALDKVKA